MHLSLTPYNKEFLDLSWIWLNDPEIKKLTMTPDFTREDQVGFFSSLPNRKDYKVWGISLDNLNKIGACGLKNIENKSAEYWGYIGEKEFWGKGLGMEMVGLVHKEAISIGLESVYLKVSIENKRAIALYRKKGYREESKSEKVMTMRFELLSDD